MLGEEPNPGVGVGDEPEVHDLVSYQHWCQWRDSFYGARWRELDGRVAAMIASCADRAFALTSDE